jgi:hypothetical protein
MSTMNNKWSVLLGWQKSSGGPLYKLGKSSTSKSEEVELPTGAFAAIPITSVLARAAKMLAEVINQKKRMAR